MLTFQSDNEDFISEEKAGIQPAKKMRIMARDPQSMISTPTLQKKIHGLVKARWTRALDAGKPATCGQPGCGFSASTMDEILEHFASCNFTPEKVSNCLLTLNKMDQNCVFFRISHAKSANCKPKSSKRFVITSETIIATKM